MKKYKRNKINLFFENNGVKPSIKNREPFLNAIPSNLVPSVTIPVHEQHPAESYFGVGPGEFFSRFNVITTISTDDKFFYPIIYSLSRLVDYVDQISIPISILEAIDQGSCKILIVCAYEGWPWFMYDALVEPLAQKHNIDLDKFVVMTGNVTKSPKYKNIVFNNWELLSRQRDTNTDYKLGKDAIFNRDSPREHKFICLNRRASMHRFGTVAKLYPYKDQGLLSFCQVGQDTHDTYPGMQYYYNQLKLFKEKYPNIYKNNWLPQKLSEKIPLLLPEHIDPYNANLNSTNPTNDEYPNKFYNSYLMITTETTVEGTVFFSEKMFKSIIYFQPFVLVGQYRALEYFKSLGYKTFSNVIDESYDQEIDIEKRLEMSIQSAIEFMQRKDLEEVMKSQWPVFEHNYKLFIDRSKLLYNKLTQDLERMLE